MNPSPSAIASIRARITDWSPSDSTIAAALNAPSIANPTPQPQLPKPFSFGDVMGCLDSGSIAKIRDLATGIDLINKINAGDVVGIGHWIIALQAGTPLITSDQATAVTAVITATIGDPTWSAQLSWAAVNLGRPADAADLAASRP